uniref:NADH dehydrogenase subunit 4L n=1 Tax=Thyasira tokunagai TaxID=3055801 RepID=UPI0030FE789F
MFEFFLFFFLGGLLMLFMQKNSLLMLLLCFEFLFLMVFGMFVWGGGIYGAPHGVIMLAAFAVAEAAVGLSLLVGLVHISGSEGVLILLQIL